MKTSNLTKYVMHPEYEELLEVIGQRSNEKGVVEALTVLTKDKLYVPLNPDHCLNVFEVLENSSKIEKELSEEEELKKRLREISIEKSQGEQTKFEQDTWDAFKRCYNQEYIIERYDENYFVLRKISNVKIEGIFGTPIDQNDSRGHVKHNFTVTCDVHETIRINNRSDEVEEKNLWGQEVRNNVDLVYSYQIPGTYKNSISDNYIQRGDYPLSEETFNFTKLLFDSQKTLMNSFIEKSKELRGDGKYIND